MQHWGGDGNQDTWKNVTGQLPLRTGTSVREVSELSRDLGPGMRLKAKLW